MTTLLLGFRQSEDNQALWRSAIKRGWDVERVRAFGGVRELDLEKLVDDDIAIYVEALWAPSVAKRLKRKLLETPNQWMENLPYHLVQRDIYLTTLAEAINYLDPVFIKPPNDKSFAARVYQPGTFPDIFDDYSMPVLVSNPVKFIDEFRCFCLDGKVLTMSPYLNNGVLSREYDWATSSNQDLNVTKFAEEVLATVETPRAIVIDVGMMRDVFGNEVWAVVEANAAWGSGIYGCDPDKVLDVVHAATEKI